MGRNIVTDTAGNAYVEVLYYSAMDMDPGPGIYQATLPTPANVLDAAVVKLDSLRRFCLGRNFDRQAGWKGSGI